MNYNSSYDNYERIGKTLARHQIITEILADVEETINANISSIKDTAMEVLMPFFYIEDSSGSGKTQAAFALKHSLLSNGHRTKKLRLNTQNVNIREPKRPFYYLVATRVQDKDQRIYKVYSTISRAFIECAEKDNLELKSDCSVTRLSENNVSLYVFGFFFELISISEKFYGSEKSEESFKVQIQKKTIQEVWLKIRQSYVSNEAVPVIKVQDIKHFLPIVVLDEFPEVEDNSNIDLLRLMRNSIRALKFGLILMGTNSNAVNLIETSLMSRQDISKYHWCSLYSRLPPTDKSLLRLPEKINDWASNVISSSRPLFASLAVENLPDNPSCNFSIQKIDKWLGKVAENIAKDKRLFKHDFGRHGQICLFLNMSYSFKALEDEKKIHRSPFIHRHFARLLNSNRSVIMKRDDDLLVKVGREYKMWNPVSLVPPPEHDVILFLSLMGTCNFFPFQSNINGTLSKASYRKGVQEIETLRKRRELVLCYDNVDQNANDGMYMEAMLASILCVGSRANGLCGCSLQEYIGAIWNHALPPNDGEMQSFKLQDFKYARGSVRHLVEFLSEFMIPVLAPPNQQWPDWINKGIGDNDGRIYFGHLRRTKNKERIDISTDFGLSGESKDRLVTSQVMQGIVDRIPNDSKVHFVFGRSYQQSYSIATPADVTFCIVRQRNNSLITLENVKGLPGKSSFKKDKSKLVLLFQIDG